MLRVDDIRSPQQKIKPRLLRHIFKPPQTSSRLVHASSFSWLLNCYKKHRAFSHLAIILVIVSWLALLITPAPADKQTNSINGSNPRTQALQQIIITADTPLAVDFTFHLQININGQPQAIPTNYGQSQSAQSIFSSTGAPGDIRVQSPTDSTYTLGDFFLLWGGQFNQHCLLNHCSSADNSLTMTVNGQANREFGNYVIRPDDRIVITYHDQPFP